MNDMPVFWADLHVRRLRDCTIDHVIDHVIFVDGDELYGNTQERDHDFAAFVSRNVRSR